MGRALITGGNGLVGTELSASLLKSGWEVYNLSRSGKAPKGAKGFKWDYLNNYVDPKALEGVDVIFHLAGANVADKRWTDSQKKVIIESRTKTAQLLFNAFKEMDRKPAQIISASGTGYYGFENNTTLFDETFPLGNGFLADVTQKWETVISSFSELGIKTSSLRIGMVLSEKGGALGKLAMPIKWGLGSPIGSGSQAVSWVHIHDLVQAFLFVQNNNLQGVYNCVAGETPNNQAFTKAIGKQLKRPVFMPNVPGFLLKALLGQMADEIILGGNASSNQKIMEKGFNFKYNSLESALKELLG